MPGPGLWMHYSMQWEPLIALEQKKTDKKNCYKTWLHQFVLKMIMLFNAYCLSSEQC